MSCLCIIKEEIICCFSDKIFTDHSYALFYIICLFIFPCINYLVNLLTGIILSKMTENNERAWKVSTNSYNVEKRKIENSLDEVVRH